ncbi:MAG: HAMP domain-containing sensor histidine kinase [Dehalococcoidia bacterium]
MNGIRAWLFSIRAKLMLALTSVILLVILIAGFVFVLQTRDDRRQQALDRVAAASPAIYQQALSTAFSPRLPGEDPGSVVIKAFPGKLDALAADQDVRIFLVGEDGTILHDTDGSLDGQRILYPEPTYGDYQRGFVAWEPKGDFDETGLTFVSSPGRVAAGEELPFNIVLAVRTDTVADAWLDVLPSLGLAGLVAVPLALVAATVLARQVAQPVLQLTRASEAMAQGRFDQRVELGRGDEMGRLARSFSVMAERVGERDTQMRALLANVSHDLKTPMTSITGYAQALTDGTAGPADVARIGGVIREEAEHVNDLLADLLFLGEIDAGQVLTRREDVPLAPIVERCVRRFEPAVAAKGVHLSVDVAPEATMHDVDPEKIERALTNVIENAVKFTSAGGWVAVRGANGAGGLAGVRCIVANSGPPIPEEDLPRVFERFFRGDRARRSSDGSGLGLAIARELVELNGGAISARNDSEGVTFELLLPA